MEEESSLNNVRDAETQETAKEIPNEPFRARCDLCLKEVTTYVRNEYNFYVFFLVIFTFYFYGLLFGLPILVLTIPLCKNITHSCPNCLSSLYEKSFYPIKFKEKYAWLQYGKCVIIMNKYIIFFILLLIISLGLFINILAFFREKKDSAKNTSIEIDEILNNYMSSSTNFSWEEVIKDCGGHMMIENSAKATEIFNRKYMKKIIEWRGYFINAYMDAFNPFMINPEHVVNINIRMIPSESMKNPDLFLSIDLNKYKAYLPLLQTLTTGDPVKFKAIFESVGNEWRPHHLHLLHIEKSEEFITNEHKVVLFQGINFNITGHLKIEELKLLEPMKNETELLLNSTLNEG